MAESIQIDFDNELADHLRAARLFYKSTFWAKGDRVVAVILVFSGACLLAIGRHWWAIVLFPIAIAEWFNVLTPSTVLTRVFFRRNPKFLEKYHLDFSDAGIHFNTATINSQVAWNHYRKMLEDDKVILLIYGTKMYSVIPKRAFRDSSQLEAFSDLVKRHIGRT